MDRYLLESSLVDGYLLEDGTGVLLLETPASEVFFAMMQQIHTGIVAQTAAGMGGVIQE